MPTISYSKIRAKDNMANQLEEPSSKSMDLKARTMVVALDCEIGMGIESQEEEMSCCCLCWYGDRRRAEW
jgi:hypothetical protein